MFGPDHPTRKRALVIKERAYGKDSITFATSLKFLGGVYGMQGREEEALTLLLRALEIAEQALGSESPDLYSFLSDVGYRYLRQKLYRRPRVS